MVKTKAKIIRIILGIFLLIASTVNSQPKSNLTLECHTSETKINKAPNGAKRVDEHTLEVKFAGGSKSFKDEGPFGYELDGVEYHYCDYNATVKFHLIEKRDQGLFTGVLMNEATGKILDAGQFVIFSPDAKKYFASRQPDGMDGELWFLYTVDGKMVWEGKSVMENLVQPNWSSDGKFQATYRCFNENYEVINEKSVTLTKTGKKWTWVPEAKCP